MTDGERPQIRVRLRKLHPGQKALRKLCKETRYVTAMLGRRWGKTYFGVDLLFNESIDRGKGYQGLWLAPTYRHGLIAAREWAARIPRELYRPHKSEKLIELYNGARIFFGTGDNPDSIIGEGYDRAIVDEGARVSEDTIDRALLPTLADRNGSALVITTPMGRRNWAFKWYSRGVAQDEGWRSLTGPSTENPNTKIQEWIKLMAPESLGGQGGMREDIYRQEILAEVLEDAASVFRNISGARVPTLRLLPWSIGLPEVIGLDLAKHQDFTVLVGVKDTSYFFFKRPDIPKNVEDFKPWLDALPVEEKANRRVVCFDRFQRIAWPLQIERVLNAVQQVRDGSGGEIDPIVALDATGIGDKWHDDLVAAGVRCLPYKFTNQSKGQLIEGTSTDIEQKHLVFPRLEVMENELLSYAYEITRSGNFVYSAPEGEHDDCVIGLGLANWGAKVRHHFGGDGGDYVEVKAA